MTTLADSARRAMADRGVPGLALTVVTPETVECTGLGTTAAGEGMPVTGHTLFRLASVTKVLTGIALLRLVEEGVLDLDRPVVEHLPRLRLRTPGAAERMTLRLLLSHRSGLPEGSIERPWRAERRGPAGLAEFAETDLPRFPLVGAPGELYFYSNLGVNLAGYVAEVAAGVPFEELMHELVLRPLRLSATTLDPTVAMTHPLAQRHRMVDGTVRVRRDGGDNTAFYPSGYAFSNAADLATLLRFFLGAGAVDGRRLLSRESIREMQTPHADVRLSRGLHYGLTCMIEPDYKGIRRIGHEGVLRGYCAKLAYAPDHGVGVAVLYNHEYNEEPRFFAARDAIVDRVFDEALGLPPGPVTRESHPVPEPLAASVRGRYGKVLGPSVAELHLAGDGLVLRLEGAEVPLRAVSGDTLVSPGTDKDLADLPWPRTPHVIDDHITVGLPVPGELITVNGQPYRRIAAR